MTTLYVSHIETSTDELGRFVTTLTQEIYVKVNELEEDIFKDVIKQVNEAEGIIDFNTSDYSVIEVQGYAVQKAIDTVNKVAEHVLIAPVTKIEEDELYKVEFDY